MEIRKGNEADLNYFLSMEIRTENATIYIY